MPKFLNKSQIIGEKGVAAFHDYCANHNPPILWREETKNDFGIDGEIEIVKRNDNGHLEVTGEILKIQIKSTETGSCISNETDSYFDFSGSLDDLTYWKNHKLSVVLVIYFVKSEQLFAKKVDNEDCARTKKRMSIRFNKKNTTLTKGENDFLTKFSTLFKGRVNFDASEIIYTNIFRFNKLPKFIYEYKSNISDVKSIFSSNIKPLPDFLLKSSKLYSFLKLEQFSDFYKAFVTPDPPQVLHFKSFMREKDKKNYTIELINKYFKDYCHKKGIGFIKDYNRYYFRKTKDTPESRIEKESFIKEVYRKESYVPKARNVETIERETVTRYNYYEKVDFYRHFAFEVYYFLDDENLYLTVTPKYLFTSDGKHVLEDKKRITRYTNFMTSREFNQQVLNHIYFVFHYLSDNRDFLTLADYDNCSISISKMITIDVPFSIDSYFAKEEATEISVPDAIQGLLFDQYGNNPY